MPDGTMDSTEKDPKGCRAICAVFGFHVFDCPNYQVAAAVDELDPLVALLIETRERAGLSQRQVVRVMGVASSSLSIWERGISEPSIRNLRAWCAALGLDLVAVTPPKERPSHDRCCGRGPRLCVGCPDAVSSPGKTGDDQ